MKLPNFIVAQTAGTALLNEHSTPEEHAARIRKIAYEYLPCDPVESSESRLNADKIASAILRQDINESHWTTAVESLDDLGVFEMLARRGMKYSSVNHNLAALSLYPYDPGADRPVVAGLILWCKINGLIGDDWKVTTAALSTSDGPRLVYDAIRYYIFQKGEPTMARTLTALAGIKETAPAEDQPSHNFGQEVKETPSVVDDEETIDQLDQYADMMIQSALDEMDPKDGLYKLQTIAASLKNFLTPAEKAGKIRPETAAQLTERVGKDIAKATESLNLQVAAY